MDEIRLADVAQVTGGGWRGRPIRLADVVKGVSTDSRSTTPGDLFVALKGDRFDGHAFIADAIRNEAVACVVQRERADGDLSEHASFLLAVSDPLDALEALGRENLRRLDTPVVAVTGSVGKTTTKEFLRALLSVRFEVAAAPRSFNNRIGVALTLLSADRSAEHLVLELGTSGPGEIAHLTEVARPRRAVVTSIARAHLGGLGSLDGVIDEKGEIVAGLPPDGVAFLNAEMPGHDRIADRAPGRIVTFGWRRGDIIVTRCEAFDPGSGHLPQRSGYRFEVLGRELTLPVPGRHNVLNAVAAVAVARDLGLSWTEIGEGLRRCRLPPRRLEFQRCGGVSFLNDSYNANPASMWSAIETFEDLYVPGRRRVAVLGDMLELGDDSCSLHEEIGRRLGGRGIDVLVTVGEDSRRLGEAFAEHAGESPEIGSSECHHFETADGAFEYLRLHLEPGDQVLLKGSNRSGIQQLATRLQRSGLGARDEEVVGAGRD